MSSTGVWTDLVRRAEDPPAGLALAGQGACAAEQDEVPTQLA